MLTYINKVMFMLGTKSSPSFWPIDVSGIGLFPYTQHAVVVVVTNMLMATTFL